MSKEPRKESLDPDAEEKKQHEDDVVVVPKGSSRTRFLLTVLLVFLVLTTFTVSGEVVDVLTGRGHAKAWASWTTPKGVKKSMKQTDFVLVKQNLDKVMYLLSGRQQRDIDDEFTARFLVTNDLAVEAGVEITNQELQKLILNRFSSGDFYRQALTQYHMSPRAFEEVLRQLMQNNRYEALLATTYSTPDPAQVETFWKSLHQEHTLEYVELPVEHAMDEARAQTPDDAGLKTWYEALSEGEKNQFKEVQQPTRAGEVASYLLDGTGNAPAVLAHHPRPPEEKAEDVARTFYDSYKDLLFRKQDPPPGQAPAPSDYQTFEEAKERCLREAPVLQSLFDWLQDMKAREAKGEAVALAQEATGMGLAYRQEVNGHPHDEWMRIAMPWVGTEFVDAMFKATTPQKFLPDVVVDKRAFLVGRLLGVQEASTPAFEQITDKVRESWLKKKAAELAKAKLEGVRAKLATQPDPADPAGTMTVEPDDAKFQAAVKDAGLEIKTREWLDPRAKAKPDQRTPLDMFLRRTAGRYGGTVGTVVAPETSADGTTLWMARISAKRDADAAQMSPDDWKMFSDEIGRQGRLTFFSSTLNSTEFMKQRYGLDMEIWNQKKEDGSGSAKTP